MDSIGEKIIKIVSLAVTTYTILSIFSINKEIKNKLL